SGAAPQGTAPALDGESTPPAAFHDGCAMASATAPPSPVRAVAPEPAFHDGAPPSPVRAVAPEPAFHDGAPPSPVRAVAPEPPSHDGAPPSPARASAAPPIGAFEDIPPPDDELL